MSRDGVMIEQRLLIAREHFHGSMVRREGRADISRALEKGGGSPFSLLFTQRLVI